MFYPKREKGWGRLKCVVCGSNGLVDDCDGGGGGAGNGDGNMVKVMVMLMLMGVIGEGIYTKAPQFLPCVYVLLGTFKYFRSNFAPTTTSS